jgi:hypothetical protein
MGDNPLPAYSPWQRVLNKVRIWALTNSPWAIHFKQRLLQWLRYRNPGNHDPAV